MQNQKQRLEGKDHSKSLSLHQASGPRDISRNAGSNENGRFDQILLTILTNLAKFVNLWKCGHAPP